MLDLVVEVSSEPIVEPGRLYVAGTGKLHGHPVPTLVCVYFHGQVADLSHPRKPVALQEPDEEIPAETGPETAQHWGKHEMEEHVEDHHPQEILRNFFVPIIILWTACVECGEIFHVHIFSRAEKYSTQMSRHIPGTKFI